MKRTKKVDPIITADFPVVGIGASAGGLAAFEALFSAMPADVNPGMAFVLVQHLAPDHKSILADLLRRYTRMEVIEVQDGTLVRPDCAYIIPPNKDMAFLNGALQLLDPVEPRGMRLPIDFFFRSLALDRHERAIGIVLSGTGSDGTLGMRAIKGEGGMMMVQQPDSTEYDGMPRSAIATGLADYVLPPAEMPAVLFAYASRAYGKSIEPVPATAPREENAIKKIFILVRAQTGHDFSLYKQNTIMRRVERRMAINQIDSIEAYVGYLQQNQEEIDALFRDLLIGVTSFFRDPDAFASVREKAIPRLFADKMPGEVIRIWVPGCSTGEEAYSIAILLAEYLEELKQNYIIQIFASDIDRSAIDTARAGIYPASIATDISPERLARFFVQDRDTGSYRIKKNIRDFLVFSEHDVIKDPPFSKLDLISCRNLLIYMGGELQKKIIPLFHYALNPGGMLLLGTSETVGAYMDLFEATDRKWKLYEKKTEKISALRWTLDAFIPPLNELKRTYPPYREKQGEPLSTVRELAEQHLLRQYAPAAAVVNDRAEVLYIHGRTGKFLEPAPGLADNAITRMAREGLRHELVIALHKASGHHEPVQYANLRVKTNGDFTLVNLIVRQMINGLFLIIFEEVKPGAFMLSAPTPAPETSPETTGTDPRIVSLEQELRAKDEYLQTILEEMETSNEELRSTNEEMQSVNEELQSTNEELETSKEELQSVNEELATVNAELQQKVHDLLCVSNDMNNLLAGTGVGIIYVDLKLCIQRFTPAVTRVINLIATDVGRPVGHIVSNLAGYDCLVQDVQAVLDTLIPREAEVQIKGGGWYLLRILPYRTMENVIEGAVITFVEFTEIKNAREVMMEHETLRRLALVVREARDAMIVQNMDGRILAFNPAAERLYGWSEVQALTMNIRDLVPEELREEALSVIERIRAASVFEPYQTRRMVRDGRIIDIRLTATALMDEAGDVYAIATIEREI